MFAFFVHLLTALRKISRNHPFECTGNEVRAVRTQGF